MRFDTNGPILKFLGRKLYNNTALALCEFVANAWDAEARQIKITIEGSGENQSIIIQDDGNGMNADELENKFLKVDYNKRDEGAKSKLLHRVFMGRKGIGKLAMIYFAKDITIYTKKKDTTGEAWSIDAEELNALSKENKPYNLTKRDFSIDEILSSISGTTIILKNLNRERKIDNRTFKALRRRMSFRFQLDDDQFQVFLNEERVLRRDSGVFEKIKFAWPFSDEWKKKLISDFNVVPDEFEQDGKQIRCIDKINNKFVYKNKEYDVSGYIAAVKKPKQLRIQYEDDQGENNFDSLNNISIFANKRLVHLDVLRGVDGFRIDVNGKHFYNYLIGEIEADFLDAMGDDLTDNTRNSLNEENEMVKAFFVYLKSEVGKIDKIWDIWWNKTKDKNEREDELTKFLKSVFSAQENNLNEKKIKKIFEEQKDMLSKAGGNYYLLFIVENSIRGIIREKLGNSWCDVSQPLPEGIKNINIEIDKRIDNELGAVCVVDGRPQNYREMFLTLCELRYLLEKYKNKFVDNSTSLSVLKEMRRKMEEINHFRRVIMHTCTLSKTDSDTLSSLVFQILNIIYSEDVKK